MDYITVYRNSVAVLNAVLRKENGRQRPGGVGCLPGSNCVNLGYVQMSAPVEPLKEARAGDALKRPDAFMSVLEVVQSLLSHEEPADTLLGPGHPDTLTPC